MDPMTARDITRLGDDRRTAAKHSHDAETVRLYLEESFSFRVATGEAAIALVNAP
jgi:uncharacterized linocin/CFP29 family protein